MKLLSLAVLLLCLATARAQLAVTVLPPKVSGSKAVVKLEMRNGFAEKVESARAVCFLTDEHGKVVGHATQWVIGGSLRTATNERPSLEPGATNAFNFVIATDHATTTNLAARVTFSGVVLSGGRLADPSKDVVIENSKKD